MLQHQRQLARRTAPGPATKFSRLNRPDARAGTLTTARAKSAKGLTTATKILPKLKEEKLLNERQIELKIEESIEDTESDESGESSDSSDDGNINGNVALSHLSEDSSNYRKVIRWGANKDLMMHQLSCSEFEMTNNCYDANNSGQGVDMQNLPSIAEQLERQRTWMTIYFRYRVNWYEARAALSKMTREDAYKPNNLPLWTRCLKVQLHRKTIFLNAIRAFRNRMQCALSGVRFTMYAFYQQKKPGESREGPEPRPLPYFRCPDDMPDLKTMVVAQLNVFVSNSTSYFDQFWDESLKENS